MLVLNGKLPQRNTTNIIIIDQKTNPFSSITYILTPSYSAYRSDRCASTLITRRSQ